ncbi:MAG: hypothetical protein F6K19_42990 [Cyanothece sp. SIO1E1]|nr:hypothetical protein [Cyanothece sp. SIO1E1]
MRKTISLAMLMSMALMAYGESPSPKNPVAGPVFEVAVRMVKDGMKVDFERARESFIKVLTKQAGVSNDREFSSFYALPQPDEREVFVGMTQYTSLETVGGVQATAEIQQTFGQFAQTMDLKAYVFMQQTEGPTFDLSKLGKQEGQVVEVAIRRMHEGMDKPFNKLRKKFVKRLSKYGGVLESYEFVVVGGPETERLSVGITVYENQAAFMKIAEPILQDKITQKYFETFDVVASQFMTSIK